MVKKPFKFLFLLAGLASIFCCSVRKPSPDNEVLKFSPEVQRIERKSGNVIIQEKISPDDNQQEKAVAEPLTIEKDQKKSGAQKEKYGDIQKSAPIGKDTTPPSTISVEKQVKPEASKETRDVVFNFDNADIYEVVKTIGELLGINYVIDPGINGTVTIHISEKLSKKDLFPIFLKILEINGLTAIYEDGLYEISTLEDLPRKSISPEFDKPKINILSNAIIQIIPLKHIPVAEMEKLLTPFVSSKESIVAHNQTNILLVTDRRKNIEKVLKIVEVLDVDVFERLKFKLYKIENIDTEELADNLKEAFLEILPSTKGKGMGVKLIPINYLNSLLVVSSKPNVFTAIDKFVNALDIASQDAEPRIYVYSVKNSEAENLSELLNEVFNGKSAKKKDKTKSEKKSPHKIKEPKFRTSAAKDGNRGSGSLRGEVTIIADKVRNSLIIEAISSDYRIIEELLGKLDVLPRQVLIDSLIAEILLDDSTKMGIDWKYTKENFRGNYNMNLELLEAGAAITSGLKYTIEKVDRIKSTLHALVTEGKVNILSSPSILASDNKEAKITISTEIPIETSEYRFTEGENVVETSIQYRDTGIILTVTPHINKWGLVTLDINQEVSQIVEESAGTSQPSFYKRTAETTLTVQDGQTIIIGGLIKQKREKGETGIPFLVNIPIIGFIFGYTRDIIEKTELIILLTPRVIVTSKDADTITEEFRNKLGKLRKELEKKRVFKGDN